MSDLRMNSAGYETPAANGCDEICKLLFAEKRRKKQKFVVSLCSGLSLRKKNNNKNIQPCDWLGVRRHWTILSAYARLWVGRTISFQQTGFGCRKRMHTNDGREVTTTDHLQLFPGVTLWANFAEFLDILRFFCLHHEQAPALQIEGGFRWGVRWWMQ